MPDRREGVWWLLFHWRRQRQMCIRDRILTVVFIVSLGHRGNNLLRLGLSLLLGGAFSNTYDRLRRGYVVDYVSFPVKWQAFRKIVFNCSDFCIIIGALLSALGML